METQIVDEIPFDRQAGCGPFPFKLGRQARAAPVGESVRFKITHMRDRLGRINRAHAGEGEIPPDAILLAPVEWRLPALLVHRRPA